MKKNLSSEEIIEKVEAIVTPYLKEMSLELVDVEFILDGGFWYLRIFIENLLGEISIEDCSILSGKIDEEIDELIEERFFLEVSSPGIERPLKKIDDFVRFKGADIKVLLKHKLEDKKSFKGKLKDVINQDEIIIATEEEENLSIPYKEIKKANISFDFED